MAAGVISKSLARAGRVFGLVVFAAALLFVFAGVRVALAVGEQAPTPLPTASTQEQLLNKGKWVEKSHKVYYKNAKGKKVKGLVVIKGKTYYFDKKGVQRTGWRKIKGKYRFFTQDSKAKGAQVTSKVVNGVKIKKDGTAVENKQSLAELKIMVAAQKRCDSIVNPTDSQATKLRKCFKWVWHKCRERGSYHFSIYSGWHRKFAWDIFDTKSGSCDSLAIGYAYLANACGASSVQVRASGGHTWAKVNGKVCDPEQANQGLGWRVYMNSGLYGSAGIYKVQIAPRTNLWGSGSSKKASSSGKSGWKKKSGKFYYYKNGKKLRKRWLKQGKKKYYLTSSGAAATKSVKVKGTYYVFNKRGVLQSGKKTRTVKVAGVTYRVRKSGKAASGWSKNHQKYYLKTGELATGVRWIDKKLWSFSDSGNYDSAKTATLRASCTKGADATNLIAALGTPVKRTAEATCRPGYLGGQEVTYVYPHIKLYAYCGEDGPELLNYIEAR